MVSLSLYYVVAIHAIAVNFCSGGTGDATRRTRPSSTFPTVRHDSGACSYVINIPAPETCKDLEYRGNLNALEERVRVLEGLLSDIVDSKNSISDRPFLNCQNESSVENFSSSVIGNTDAPGQEVNIATIAVNKPLREVVPRQPLGPYIYPPHPPVKPREDDMTTFDHVMVALNESDVFNDGKQVAPKKPSTITSTRPSGGQEIPGRTDPILGSFNSRQPGDIVDPRPSDATDSTDKAHFPDIDEVIDASSERSLTSEIEGGSYLIYSSSDGGTAESTPSDGEDNTDPTEVHDSEDPEITDADKDTATPSTPKPFMGIMKSQDGHRGNLNKPRWKIFKELMDLKTLRGNMADGEKRPRPKGRGKHNDCIIDGCLCLKHKGFTEDGIYYMDNPEGSGKRGKRIRLFCDMTTEGGGWTVIQRRQNGTTNFYRGWDDYVKGFGYLDADFWIGNAMLHAITSRTNFILRVEFTDWDDVQGYAEYRSFRVNDETDYFRLILGEFMTGNAGDALSYHNNSQFSTRDRDHDSSIGNCAYLRQAGFWFRSCNRANPNGRWLARADARGLNGAVVNWGTWEGHKYTYCLKSIRMMIRSQNAIGDLTADVEDMDLTRDG